MRRLMWTWGYVKTPGMSCRLRLSRAEAALDAEAVTTPGMSCRLRLCSAKAAMDAEAVTTPGMQTHTQCLHVRSPSNSALSMHGQQYSGKLGFASAHVPDLTVPSSPCPLHACSACLAASPSLTQAHLTAHLPEERVRVRRAALPVHPAVGQAFHPGSLRASARWEWAGTQNI